VARYGVARKGTLRYPQVPPTPPIYYGASRYRFPSVCNCGDRHGDLSITEYFMQSLLLYQFDHHILSDKNNSCSDTTMPWVYS
jgi:hypothetical protein